MQQQPLQSVRKRARKACESCRKRKRRCDGAQPCRSCAEYEYPCFYADQQSASTTTTATIVSRPGEPIAREDTDLDQRPLRGGSLVAFPRAVARALYGQSVPVRHGFGFNIGMPISTAFQDPTSETLESAMSLDTAERFCQRYCNSCGILFPVVESDTLVEELRKLFSTEQTQRTTPSIEVAITFAVLLGSYFSWPLLNDKHDALLLHAQQELDRLTFRQCLKVDNWLLRAWILRTILLKMTSLPDLAWLSSCNMMHVAELAREQIQQEPVPLDMTGSIATEKASTILDLASILNQIISLESGRSTAAFLPSVLHTNEGSDHTGEIFQLRKTFRRMQELETGMSTSAARTCIQELCHDRITSSVMLDTRTVLIEACVLCGIYRQIFKRLYCLDAEVVAAIKTIFMSALVAAEELVETGEPWFMLAEFPSQFACICLALGRPLMELLPRVSTLLGKITKRFDSGALKATEETIALLIEACLRSRDEDKVALQKSLRCLSNSSTTATSVEEETWTQFLNQQVFD